MSKQPSEMQLSEIKELHKLIEILETIKYCDGNGIKIKEEKRIEALDTTIAILSKLIKDIEQKNVENVMNIENMEINVYDEEEIYPDCTVQVLKNSVTGKISVGWWKNS